MKKLFWQLIYFIPELFEHSPEIYHRVRSKILSEGIDIIKLSNKNFKLLKHEIYKRNVENLVFRDSLEALVCK